MKFLTDRMLLAGLLITAIADAQTPDISVPEFKLAFLPSKMPAIRAFLGDPAIGTPMPARELKMVWHPSGRLFLSNDDNAAPVEELVIQVWSAPIGPAPPKFKGFLNAAGGWSLSNRGDLLCAQAYVSTEEYPYHSENEYNAVSCFSFADSSRVWKFPLEDEAQVAATCFSKDDKKILVAAKKKGFCTLHLLNAETGQEESRTTLPGNLSVRSSRSIVAVGDGFVLQTRDRSGSAVLQQVSLNPLAVDTAPFKNLNLGEFYHLLVSANENHLVTFGSEGYEVLSFQNGVWKSSLDGHVRDAWSQSGSMLRDAALSPDNRLLYVGTSSGAKVIDLVAQKVVKDFPQGCEAASFSPDGSIMLTSEHSGIGTWETRSWNRQPTGEAQHDCPVLGVRFLPDGKTVISHDHNGFIVWDLDSRKPRAILKGMRGELSSSFHHFAFANEMRDVIAGDGWDYLRWTLPDLRKPVPVKPEQIVGVRVFGDLASQKEKCGKQEIYADLTGRHFITLNDEGVQWRDLSAPARIKTLSSAKGIRFGVEGHVIFLDDGKLCLHDYDDRMHHLDIASDQLTQVAEHKDVRVQGLWLPGRQCYVALAKAGIQFIDAHTGAVTQTLVRPRELADFSPIFQGGFCVAVSIDEKIAAAYMNSPGVREPMLSLWDIDSGKILAVQRMSGLDINCLDFSPDGRILAVGHKNTAISLWDVGQLLESKPPVVEEPQAAAKDSASSKPYRLVSSRELPQQSLADKQGHKWSFNQDGSLAIDAKLPSFGVIKVNGKPFVNKGSSYTNRNGDQKIAAPFSIQNVGEIEGEGVWINRTLGLPGLFGLYDRTVIQAVDGFTNLTEKALKTEIAFQVRFPTDSKGLLRGADLPWQIPADGRFSLTGDDLWLAAAGSGKIGESLAAVRVQARVSPITPELHWDSAEKIITLTYRVEIPAGETRWLVHGVSLVNRFPEGSIDSVERFPDHADIGHYIPAGNRLQGINFGIPDLWDPAQNKGPLPSAMSWSNAEPKPKPESDSLGFSWETQHDRGRLGELGASSVYQIWIDGHPASPSSLNSLLHQHVNGKLVIPQVASLGDNPSRIHITRRDHMMEEGGATVWHDRFFNGKEEPQIARVSYVTTFKSPVVEVWDLNGKRYDPANLKGSTAGLGGACAFVLEGEQQPATLLAFHKGEASQAPSIRWLGPQAVVLDYELKMEPRSFVGLLHGACQRPLKAFGGPAAAFADWLPLKMPPPLPRLQPSASSVTKSPTPVKATGSSPGALQQPVLNYQVAPPP